MKLKKGHVIHTLMAEHDIILDFLDKLENLNSMVQKEKNLDNKDKKVGKLRFIIEHLIGAEPHHLREEKVLFPEIEKMGLIGPPEIMKMEHEELRKHKKDLKKLLDNFPKTSLDIFKKELDETSQLLVPLLRQHIEKENKILYPAALEVIKEEKTWEEIKEKCDKIGYCCFTPT